MKIPMTTQQIERLVSAYPTITKEPLNICSAETMFEFSMTIVDDGLECMALDDEGEVYTLFDITPSPSQLAQQLQEEYRQWLQQTIAIPNSIQTYWTQWIEEYFQVVAQHPFKKMPETATFLTQSKKKWFALLIEVPLNVITPEGVGKVWILNVKVQPELREQLIDGIHIFEAYHMNKKHWVSILLDERVEDRILINLLKESYRLVEG